MNACKEDSCYVTLEYEKDMKTSKGEAAINLRKNPDFKYQISRDYVLPDFTSIRRGFLKVSSLFSINLLFVYRRLKTPQPNFIYYFLKNLGC